MLTNDSCLQRGSSQVLTNAKTGGWEVNVNINANIYLRCPTLTFVLQNMTDMSDPNTLGICFTC